MILDSVCQGKLTLIIGDQGTGKTTLALTIAAAMLAQSATVAVIAPKADATYLQTRTLPGAMFCAEENPPSDADLLLIDDAVLQHGLFVKLPKARRIVCVLNTGRYPVDQFSIPSGLFMEADTILQTYFDQIKVIKARRFYNGDTFPVQFARGLYVGLS